ncbi:MAG: bifunctional diaminohydroxyphosphoribosylaminopyrimidine deaminase/5-amino-6-(5-phosphoribosylamino)uracil reductase RibD [Candidatus Saganbacteria bacterium]|nr:bifunctional diaminohydroxyphosphoribosylaminopyrimidine deaminase/5-amino-6-(5-phosphoribosylamino)uracil reductase RibD [Candidatus Saganbacteria bacterium]
MTPQKNGADIKFMREALKLASKVLGLVSPDPAVGAVIVKNGKIISKGYHNKFSTPHAEDYAIRKAGKSAKGSTLYINLEPCCHYGNNPPCTDNIIRSGIKRVVAAMKDPNPLVNGKGFKRLKKAGIKVDVGLLENEAAVLNEFFVGHITTKRPFVILKMAMSLDGKIATKLGESRWISGDKSREFVHYLRGIVDAVMVGIGTLLKDDPLLNVRNAKGKNLTDPLKIIIDPEARVLLCSKVLQDPSRVIVAVSEAAPAIRVKKLEGIGAKVIKVRSRKGEMDLGHLLSTLGKQKITSIMIEGGGNLAASAIGTGIVDKVVFIVAPKIIGGKTSPTPVEGKGIDILARALRLKNVSTRRLGEDIIIEGYLK